MQNIGSGHKNSHRSFGVLEVGMKRLVLLVIGWLGGNGIFYGQCWSYRVHSSDDGQLMTVVPQVFLWMVLWLNTMVVI